MIIVQMGLGGYWQHQWVIMAGATERNKTMNRSTYSGVLCIIVPGSLGVSLQPSAGNPRNHDAPECSYRVHQEAIISC